MQVIPLQPIPNQVVNVVLGNQNCTIVLFQRDEGLFCNLYVGSALVIGGVACQNINRIVRDAYLGFVGDLIFEDLQGDSDPDYTGLGSRWMICYITPADTAQAELV
jgi:hypothetical protein